MLDISPDHVIDTLIAMVTVTSTAMGSWSGISTLIALAIKTCFLLQGHTSSVPRAGFVFSTYDYVEKTFDIVIVIVIVIVMASTRLSYFGASQRR